MKHRNSHLLIGYWSRLRNGRAVPDQLDVDPRAIKSILSRVFILDASDPTRPVYRLAGSAQCERYGLELKGRFFLAPWELSSRDAVISLLEESLTRCMPVCLSSRADAGGCGTLDIETVLAPISFGTEIPTRFLGVSHTLGDAGTARGFPVISERLVWSEVVREQALPAPTESGTAAPLPSQGGSATYKNSHLRLVINRDKPLVPQASVEDAMLRLIEALEIVPDRIGAA